MMCVRCSNYADLQKFRDDCQFADSVADSFQPWRRSAVAEKNMIDGIPMVCLSTAHPAKFASAIQQALGDDLAHHPVLDALVSLPTRRVTLKPERDIIEGYMKQELA